MPKVPESVKLTDCSNLDLRDATAYSLFFQYPLYTVFFTFIWILDPLTSLVIRHRHC